MIEFPAGSSGWFGGILLILMAVASCVAIEGFWFASQRELEIAPRRVHVRRWIDVWLGRPGLEIAFDATTEVELLVERGKQLVLRHAHAEVRIWVGLWRSAELIRLVDAFGTRGVNVHAGWRL
jgi:hypothetical protein